ncbi:MAG: nitrile hydratase subunit alpha [Rhodospirillaceae bacterium]|nr:nitrile hydratase subunit alpha [Rhodospirillaceae bacterium]MBE90618.1 nitrile hydratase subunit alpha [Rhodospirillaceae bacterium]
MSDTPSKTPTISSTAALIERSVAAGEHELLEKALRALLLEKSVIDADQLAYYRAEVDTRGPFLGASLAARAWTDANFKTFLLDAPKEAVYEHLGIRISQGPEFIVLANTPTVHHVIVCTLCSCYPKAILGLPPEWYKSFAYRSQMVVEPKAILAEFGTHLPDDVEIRVVDSTADMRYMVLPMRPAGTEDMTVEQLQVLITRDNLIGVTLPTLS